MTPRLILAAVASLSLTGCVAAVPMVAQLASNPNSLAQLCSIAKIPGQSTSLCDRISSAQTAPTPTAPKDKTVNTAER